MNLFIILLFILKLAWARNYRKQSRYRFLSAYTIDSAGAYRLPASFKRNNLSCFCPIGRSVMIISSLFDIYILQSSSINELFNTRTEEQCLFFNSVVNDNICHYFSFLHDIVRTYVTLEGAMILVKLCVEQSVLQSAMLGHLITWHFVAISFFEEYVP